MGNGLSGNLPDSRVSETEDLKALYQPIMELCALGELCQIQNDTVPIIGIYGSRYSYKPLLFFREHDVLYTTRTPFTYWDDKGQVDLHGLVFLRALAMLEQYPINVTYLTSGKKLGWKDARGQRCPDIFRTVF